MFHRCATLEVDSGGPLLLEVGEEWLLVGINVGLYRESRQSISHSYAVPSSNFADALAEVYDEISGLERTEREDIRYTDYDDLYHWLIIPAAALLLLEVLLRRGPYLELAA